MSTYTRASSKSKRKLRHSAARGRTHAEDKRQAEARRGIFVVLPKAAAGKVGPTLEERGMRSSERIHRGGRIIACEGEEQFADYIEAEAGERNWAYQHRMKLGKEVTVRIPVPTAVEVVVVSFSPWANAYIADLLAAGGDGNALALKAWSRFCDYAKSILVGDWERYFLGEALHADTHVLHGDLLLSRQEDGMRVGRAGFTRSGPWFVGVDRQLRAGATINSKKQRQYRRSAQQHFRRYGQDSRPCDVLLARALDKACDETMGPELARYRVAYAASVPAREQAAAKAQLDRLEAAKDALMENFDVQEPSMGFGP